MPHHLLLLCPLASSFWRQQVFSIMLLQATMHLSLFKQQCKVATSSMFVVIPQSNSQTSSSFWSWILPQVSANCHSGALLSTTNTLQIVCGMPWRFKNKNRGDNNLSWWWQQSPSVSTVRNPSKGWWLTSMQVKIATCISSKSKESKLKIPTNSNKMAICWITWLTLLAMPLPSHSSDVTSEGLRTVTTQNSNCQIVTRKTSTRSIPSIQRRKSGIG